MRSPHNTDSLEQLKLLLPDPIETVIDVGVQYATPFLMECFPNAFHYLIEPVSIYHDAIVKKYNESGISHNLIKSAASDVEGILYQHLQTLDGSGKITHSQLLGARFESLPGLVDIVATPVVKLNSISYGVGHYLVKIDVDGIEEKIIRGGEETIKRASIVIIETPLRDFTKRARLLEALDMELFDITDMCYYYNQLQQVDLIFVNKAITTNNHDFRPFQKHPSINWVEWRKL